MYCHHQCQTRAWTSNHSQEKAQVVKGASRPALFVGSLHDPYARWCSPSLAGKARDRGMRRHLAGDAFGGPSG